MYLYSLRPLRHLAFFAILSLVAVSCINKKENKNEASTFNEPALKSFITSTPAISDTTALNMLDSIFNKANEDSAVFLKTVSYFETPLGDPNSSYRNENLYINLLQAKIKSPWYSSTVKAAARKQLYLIMQNIVGTTANDFTYITPAGFKKKMYNIHSDFTLLYFYNPECDACKQMNAALVRSELIKSKVKNQTLKVLAVYVDRDEKVWLNHLSEMPSAWIQGRDENEYLYKNNVYDLKAIPTLYLLDRKKKVLLKDCMDVALIEQKLSLTE